MTSIMTMTTPLHLRYAAPLPLLTLVALLGATGCSVDVSADSNGATVQATGDTTMTADGPTFRGAVLNPAGELVVRDALPKVVKSDAEWKADLSTEQFRILRRAGTERAGTGALLYNVEPGMYTCAACELPLFSSTSKFKSGTGWPSFYEPIAAGNVDEHDDMSLGVRRVEIVCARCDGHLGHVFNDGPQPTGLRYCLNSAAMAFTPTDRIGTLAEPATRRTPATNPSPSSARDQTNKGRAEASVVIAGGCFWCVEAVFEELEGVYDAISGYAGGDAATANYKAVVTGSTKHAEAVQIRYDPTKINYENILRVHFATHDPTTLNRQGADVGPQYRSAIFVANEEERAVANAFIDDINRQKVFAKPVVTTVEPLTRFFPAEPYHQNYVCNNPGQSYVRSVALPKVKKVRKHFADRLKETSPLEQRP